MVGQDIGPDRVLRVWGMRDDPEALAGMVDHRNDLGPAGRDRPVLAEEVQGVIGVEAALEVERQVEIQQRDGGHGAQARALFLEGFVPSVVGGQPGGAADVLLVVPVDLGLEESVGGFEIGRVLEGQKGDQAPLESVKAAFDLAFGLRVGSDAMGHAQGGEGALELRVGVEAVGGGTVAEEGQAIGVEASRRAIFFQGRAQMGEVAPGRVAGHERAGDDFAGVVIGGEEERGVSVVGPPGMGRGVVLPEFADGGALPAAARFGAGRLWSDEGREVLADVGGDGRAGAGEAETAVQFVGQEGEVERLAVGQTAGEEIAGGLRPRGVVVAAGGLREERAVVLQPLVAQLVETSRSDVQSLGGGEGIESAVVESCDDFLDVKWRNTVS